LGERNTKREEDRKAGANQKRATQKGQIFECFRDNRSTGARGKKKEGKTGRNNGGM